MIPNLVDIMCEDKSLTHAAFRVGFHCLQLIGPDTQVRTSKDYFTGLFKLPENTFKRIVLELDEYISFGEVGDELLIKIKFYGKKTKHKDTEK